MSHIFVTDEMVEESKHDGRLLFEYVLMAAIGREVTEPNMYDSDAILFAVWVDLIRHLASRGWTAKSLADDVLHHAGVIRAN